MRNLVPLLCICSTLLVYSCRAVDDNTLGAPEGTLTPGAGNNNTGGTPAEAGALDATVVEEDAAIDSGPPTAADGAFVERDADPDAEIAPIEWDAAGIDATPTVLPVCIDNNSDTCSAYCEAIAVAADDDVLFCSSRLKSMSYLLEDETDGGAHSRERLVEACECDCNAEILPGCSSKFAAYIYCGYQLSTIEVKNCPADTTQMPEVEGSGCSSSRNELLQCFVDQALLRAALAGDEF